MKITKNCGNVFANIGFPPDEAANIIARATLTARLIQRAAAKLFGTTQPRVNLLLNGKTGEFSVDVLVNMLGHAKIARRSWTRSARELR